MRFGGEGDQIADSEVARADGEFGVKRQAAQRGKAAGAAAGDRQLVAVDIAASREKFCARNTIHDVRDAPLAIELFPVSPAVSGASTIIHVEKAEAPAGPELHGKIET